MLEKIGAVLVLLLFSFSCSQGDGYIDTNPPRDSNVIDECNEDTNIDYDFHHCGECDNSCSIDDADRCIEGVCMCGTEVSCTAGYDCRNGSCVARDPSGLGCEFDPECPVGYGCIEGRCTSLNCVPEACDGFDNDCDRRIDEGPSPGIPLARYCGTSDPSLHLPCRQGSQLCSVGEWGECIGAVNPTTESGLLACNGIDDDCDGCVDSIMTDEGVCERLSEDTQYDIVFIVDTSGSMSAAIRRVQNAIDSFSSVYSGSPDFRFALVTIAPQIESADRTVIVQDLTDIYGDFAFAIADMRTNGNGAEGTYDAPYAVMTDTLSIVGTDAGHESTGLSWREGSVRVLVELTDEGGQSYRTPMISEEDMCSSSTHGELLVFFTTVSYKDDYIGDCGIWFNLYDFENFNSNLSSVFTDPCP